MVDVPTMDQFNALAARVAALEGVKPPSTSGATAKRIADVIELFGVNTFSSLDDGNVWGSWPADYRPASVCAALDYMTKGSGFGFRLREYHYKGRETIQQPWLRQIIAAQPLTRASMCIGANGSAADVASMIALATDPACGIKLVEGLNEPNNDFGSGTIAIDQTKLAQDAVWTGAQSGFAVALGPSVVAGTPHPEGWITGYCGADLAAINLAMHAGNGHYYPPGCPDLPDTGYSIYEYIDGLAAAYGHAIHLTEFHPSLYNSEGNKPDQPGWDGNRDAFYTLLALFRAAKCGGAGLVWYALFDYGTTYACGLFPKSGTDQPRPAATALRNLCAIVADPSTAARTFTPGALGVTVNAPAPCDSDLYQASDGRFLVPVWRPAKDLGGATVPVDVGFAAPVARVDVFDPIASTVAIDSQQHIADLSLALPAGVRLLVVTP